MTKFLKKERGKNKMENSKKIDKYIDAFLYKTPVEVYGQKFKNWVEANNWIQKAKYKFENMIFQTYDEAKKYATLYSDFFSERYGKSIEEYEKEKIEQIEEI